MKVNGNSNNDGKVLEVLLTPSSPWEEQTIDPFIFREKDIQIWKPKGAGYYVLCAKEVKDVRIDIDVLVRLRFIVRWFHVGMFLP